MIDRIYSDTSYDPKINTDNYNPKHWYYSNKYINIKGGHKQTQYKS